MCSRGIDFSVYNYLNVEHMFNKVVNIKNVVFFNQKKLLSGGTLPPKLDEINKKFGGLCELICNKILIDDLLGKEEKGFLYSKINLDVLNDESIVKSHLLNVYSVFTKAIAFLFSIYPDNIFSIRDQWNLVQKQKLNTKIFFEGLKNIKPGETLKVEIIKRKNISLQGHSLLIKKTSENTFTFFDPNSGACRELSQEDLAQNINRQLTQWQVKDVFLLKGDSYIQKLREKNIIK